MLTYLNQGERSFFEHPTLPYRRSAWEFFAVIDGLCAPIDRPNHQPKLNESRLWVMPPNDFHGWTGQANETCHILVAHFDTVPSQLADTPIPRSVALTAPQIEKLRAMFLELEDDYVEPTEITRLRAERLKLELTITILADSEKSTRNTAGHKAAAALAWYAEHLPERPGVEDVAQAVSVSPSHLRRLFLQATGMSPLEAMKQVQHDRAKQLMRRTNMSLNDVSIACGFSAQSVFSRDFAKRQNITPLAWRNRKED